MTAAESLFKRGGDEGGERHQRMKGGAKETSGNHAKPFIPTLTLSSRQGGAEGGGAVNGRIKGGGGEGPAGRLGYNINFRSNVDSIAYDST